MTDWLVDEQTTTRPSSHGEDGVSEGGWSGYPSDSQTTLKKLNVGLCDDRDRAAEVLESETSGPVSSSTRSKERRVGVDRAGATIEMVTMTPIRIATQARHYNYLCNLRD